jgi:type VI protein secretion system component Hcp
MVVLALLAAIAIAAASWQAGGLFKSPASAGVLHPRVLSGNDVLTMSATGIQGEAPTGGLSANFEITDWSYGVTNKPGSTAAYGTFIVKRKVDSASPSFFTHCVGGSRISQVKIVESPPPGSPGSTLTFTFGSVFVTSVSWSKSDDGTPPTETIGFTATTHKVTYA